ncbi:MAG: DUF7007 domain-containing protein [Candidatus Thorarchaeota archaeon]|jgi:hypothetical protein
MTFPLSPEITKNSPWGKVQTIQKIGTDGLVFVTTAGHGGFYVPPLLNARMSEEGRDHGLKWAKGWTGWYEEDCSAAYVARDLPEYFSVAQTERATKMIEQMKKFAL